jgi:hypothetical protein
MISSFIRGIPGSLLVTGLLAVGMWATAQTTGPLPVPADRKVDFGTDIVPLLQTHCFQCHKGSDAKSDHRLDVRAAILGEIDDYPLAVPGKSGESRIIKAVAGQTKGKQMPPGKNKRLTDEEISLLRAWIDQGLAWDEKLLPVRLEVSHWAFKPVTRPNPPAPPPGGGAWGNNPIDAFVAEKMQAHGLQPAPEAPRHVLVRRLYLDLLGLPPGIDEMEAVLADTAPDWYEKLVEKLLASPHHGERWARHWLDVARYADSEGYENDAYRPFAWRYRDFVIRSFNEDRPYAWFIRQQVAGDELIPYDDENLIATGFLACARYSGNEEDKPTQRNDVLVDIVNATSNSLLGLSLHCAQCHNHKWDPLTHRDYYRFQGFFVKGQMNNLGLKGADLWKEYEAAIPKALAPAEELRKTLLDQARARLTAEAKKKLPADQRAALDTPADKRSPKQQQLAKTAEKALQFKTEDIEKAIAGEDRELYAALKKRIDAMRKNLPEKPQTIGFYSPAGPHQVDVLQMKANYPLPYNPEELKRTKPALLLRGDPSKKGPELDVGWPAVFGPTPPEKTAKSPRLALADWLADPANPLTSRVWVNRLWAWHFGRGIVATANDFGTKGTPPTHPELLDWLASELMNPSNSLPPPGEKAGSPSDSHSPLGERAGVRGWSTKHIHRLIVTSATYRQSSQFNAEHAKIDPDNRWLWHWRPRRLESESIRDALLAVSGELVREIGGPSVALVDRDRYKSTEPLREREGIPMRRSIYLRQMRDAMPPMQLLFDGPTANESCGRRHVSTVSLQPLFLLNSEFMLNRAKAFAGRVTALAGNDRKRQIEEGYQLALGRLPRPQEMEVVEPLFETRDGQGNALLGFCHLLMNLNEFVYIE